MRMFPTTTMNRCSVLLAIPLLVWIPWNAVQGKDYLVAIHRKSYTRYSRIVVYTWGTGGMMQIQYPSYQHKVSYPMSDTSTVNIEEKMGTTKGIESNTIVLTCSNLEAKILVQSDNFRSNIFSPLPVTSLGKRYIVSSCDRSGQYRPFLVIATHKEETDVDITFNITGSVSYDGRSYGDGDKLSLTLGAYQTFTFRSYYDLTGSVINSTHTIALFTGLLNTTSVVAYDQLPPVEHYSTEYVVAVDDNTSPYNLQIISDKKKTRITFNNGSSVFLNESGLYRGNLRPSEMFHFTTSNPVMTTLCRINGERSGFVLVPPVSNFNSQRRFNIYRTATILLTSISTEMKFSPSSISKVWKHIPNSRYKVGEFRSTSSVQVTSDTAFTGSLMFYQDYSIYSCCLSSENATSVPTKSNDMTSYILAVPRNAYVHLTAVGETGGFWQVQYPYKEEWYSRQSSSFTADYFYFDNEMKTIRGIENKTILVHAEISDLHMTCSSRHPFYGIISFSPLPISALGTKYIISSCHSPYVNTSLLTIATGNETTNASITFRLEDKSFSYDGKTYFDGDTLRVILQAYQTLTISFQVSVCGSTILASTKIAVFVGTGSGRYDTSFYQILPVRLYGKEYVIAVGESNNFYRGDSIQYHLLVVSEHNDTPIIFSNEETASVGDRNNYLRSLKINESLLFTASKPVMASLCMYNEYSFLTSDPQYTCVILPPKSLHTYSTGMVTIDRNEIKLLTEKTTNNLQVKRSIGRSWIETISVDWKDIPNTNYKVGTCTEQDSGTWFVNSKSRFTVLGYGTSYQNIFNGGYNFHGLRTETTSVTGSASQVNTHSSTAESSIHSITLASNNNAAQNSTILAVGVTCGFIILVLAVVIVGLFIYIRWNIGWRGQKEDKQRGACRTNRERSSPQQETSFTADDGPAVANVAVITDQNTYSNLFSEDQCESAYEQISQNNSQYMNIERC